ncbi:MAG: hypothetical protein ACYTG7_15350 [Planctomycetota bacterium]
MEEDAVYAAYFSSDYYSIYDLLVIQSLTSIWFSLNADDDNFYRKVGLDPSDPEVRNRDPARLLGIRLRRMNIPHDVLKSFHERNKQRVHHREDMDLGIDYVLLSRKENNRIFSQGKGWRLFREEFPDARGLTVLSRVGLNDDRTVALLYVGFYGGMLWGDGFVILFKKIDGTWKRAAGLRIWVS